MALMQLDFDEKENKIIEIVQALHSFDDKRDAVKFVIRNYKIKGVNNEIV